MTMARLLLALSITLYLACLPLNAFCVNDGGNNWPAWGILLFGFFPFGESLANLIWFANPILFTAWACIYLRVETMAKVLSLTSLLTAASFMLMHKVVTSESGTASTITGYRAAYWIWLASMAVAVAAALTSARRPVEPVITL